MDIDRRYAERAGRKDRMGTRIGGVVRGEGGGLTILGLHLTTSVRPESMATLVSLEKEKMSLGWLEVRLSRLRSSASSKGWRRSAKTSRGGSAKSAGDVMMNWVASMMHIWRPRKARRSLKPLRPWSKLLWVTASHFSSSGSSRSPSRPRNLVKAASSFLGSLLTSHRRREGFFVM